MYLDAPMLAKNFSIDPPLSEGRHLLLLAAVPVRSTNGPHLDV